MAEALRSSLASLKVLADQPGDEAKKEVYGEEAVSSLRLRM